MLTIKEIVKQSGIPENTVRRYLTVIGDHVPRGKQGRSYEYPDEIVACVLQMYGWYQEGKTTSEILDLLAFPTTITVVPEGGGKLTPESPDEMMQRFVDRLTGQLSNEVRVALSEERDLIVKERDALVKENESMKKILNEQTQILKKYQTALDKQTESLSAVQDYMLRQAEKPWWKLW